MLSLETKARGVRGATPRLSEAPDSSPSPLRGFTYDGVHRAIAAERPEGVALSIRLADRASDRVLDDVNGQFDRLPHQVERVHRRRCDR